jgi:hypothetical protein
MFNRETHKSRGFGFIVFELEGSVDGVCAQREHFIDGKLVSPLDHHHCTATPSHPLQVEVKRAVPRSKILSPVSSSCHPPLSSSSSSFRQSAPSFINTSRSHSSDQTDTSPFPPSPGGLSSYAAALKSGSSETRSTRDSPSLSSSPSPQSQSFLHTHGLLSEPINVTGYHLRSHANTLSDLDLQHQHSTFGYDYAFKQQQHRFHDEQNFHSPTSSLGSPSVPSRHRALTESYLLMQSQQQQPFLRQHSYGSVLNPPPPPSASHYTSSTPDYLHHDQRSSPGPLNAFSSPSSPSHQHGQLNRETVFRNSANTAHPSSSWNSDVESQRGHIERSVSFGGVGWAPSSLTSSSRRGFSDVGLNDLTVTLNSSPTHHLGPPAAPSSKEAWSSFIDLGMELHLPPPPEDSTNGLSVRRDDEFYAEYDLSLLPATAIVNLSRGEESGGIQELRLQAREFIPMSQQRYQPTQERQSQDQQWISGCSPTASSPLIMPSQFT